MALFNKKKKNQIDQQPIPAGNDIFDKVFNEFDVMDAATQQMIDYTKQNQPQTIVQNHQNFISDFDSLQIQQSRAFMQNDLQQNVPNSQYAPTVASDSYGSFQATQRLDAVPRTAAPAQASPMSAQVGLASVIGMRDSQQDAASVSDLGYKAGYGKKWMAVLCDGMGGMNGGEKASNLCVEKMLSNFANIGTQSVPDFIKDSIVEIDDAVYNLRDSNGDHLGAGSTMVSVVIDGDNLYWGSVGDSHLYIIRGRDMLRVNDEHNYYAELMEKVNAGEMTLEEANSNPHKEALTSFMGIGDITLMHVSETPLKLYPNDMIIICSDGLYRSASFNEMYSIAMSNSNNMSRAADELIKCALAKKKKYQDNTTVITIKYM